MNEFFMRFSKTTKKGNVLKSLSKIFSVMILSIGFCKCMDDARKKSISYFLYSVSLLISTWWKFILFSNSSHCHQNRKYIGSGRLAFITQSGNEGFFLLLLFGLIVSIFFFSLLNEKRERKPWWSRTYIMRKPKYDCQVFCFFF